MEHGSAIATPRQDSLNALASAARLNLAGGSNNESNATTGFGLLLAALAPADKPDASDDTPQRKMFADEESAHSQGRAQAAPEAREHKDSPPRPESQHKPEAQSAPADEHAAAQDESPAQDDKPETPDNPAQHDTAQHPASAPDKTSAEAAVITSVTEKMDRTRDPQAESAAVTPAAAQTAAPEISGEEATPATGGKSAHPTSAARAESATAPPVLPAAEHPAPRHEARAADDRPALSTTERQEPRIATTPADPQLLSPAAGSTSSAQPANLLNVAVAGGLHGAPPSAGAPGAGASSAIQAGNAGGVGAAAQQAHNAGGAGTSFTPSNVQRAPQAPPAPAVDQINLHLLRAAKAGQEQISFRLNPAELGRIDIKLEFAPDRTLQHVRVLAETPQALEALQKDQRVLERTLQDAGLQNGSTSMEFSLREQHAGQRDARASLYNGKFARLALERAADDALAQGLIPAQAVPAGRVDIRV